MSATPAAQLWRFALALYARPGVAPALIGLQDRLGLDVDVALYCAWCARTGRDLDAKAIRHAVRQTRVWQRGTVARLRALRRALKVRLAAIADPAEARAVAAFRAAVQKLEIGAERVELGILARAAGPAGTLRTGATLRRVARAHLDLYVASLAKRQSHQDKADLAAVCRAVTSV
jgi:uncharacterized protein (TIGR02444 family)